MLFVAYRRTDDEKLVILSFALLWKDACYLNKRPTIMCLAKKKKKEKKKEESFALF